MKIVFGTVACFRLYPGNVYYEELVATMGFTAVMSDLKSNKIDTIRGSHNSELLAEPSLEYVIDHMRWTDFFWVLPPRRTLPPWFAFSPTLLLPIVALLGTLILTWWIIARIDLVQHYRSLIYTMFTLISLSMSSSIPTIPTSKKLKALMLMALLVFIPLNVSLQAIWTSTLTTPIREPKITNIEQLARSDIPMRFGYSLLNFITSGLSEETIDMIKAKQKGFLIYARPDEDLYGRSGTALFAIDTLLPSIRNQEDVEKFVQVRGRKICRRIDSMPSVQIRPKINIVELKVVGLPSLVRSFVAGSKSLLPILPYENRTSLKEGLSRNDLPYW